MRLFAKFYPDVDIVTLDLATSATINDLRAEIEKLTNLKGGDVIKILANNAIVSGGDLNMWTLGIKPDTTFHIVVEHMVDGPLKVNTPKELGPLGALEDEVMANIFSFLDAVDIVTTSAVSRKWRVIGNAKQSIVWSPLIAQLYQAHQPEESKESHHKFSLKTKAYKRAYMDRIKEERAWKHVRDLSHEVKAPSELPKFEKEKEVRIKRKPKGLTEEEEKFLSENDLKVLKKQLRTHKDAKEKVKQYQAIEKKKEESEFGAWKGVPEQYSPNFTYEQLMIHSFGFKDEQYTGFYDGKARFYIVNSADGKLVFIGEVEVDQERYKFGRIIIDDSNTDTQMAVTQKFYELWEKFKTNGVEEKNLIKLLVLPDGLKDATEVDAVADILVINKKFTSDAKLERPEVTIKRAEKPQSSPRKTSNQPLLSPRGRSQTLSPSVSEESSQITFQGQCVTYKDDEGVALSLQNISEAYVANFVAALKSEEVATLALPSLETAYLAKLGKTAEEFGQEIEGKSFAQGLTAYLKETEKLRLKQQQQQGAQTDENAEDPSTGNTPQKRYFQKAYLVVKSDEEMQRVKQGIQKHFA